VTYCHATNGFNQMNPGN